MSDKKVLIIAGEPSGDIHASNLVLNLKKLKANIKFFGLGGELSKKAGVDVIYDISKLAIVGLTEVITHAIPIREAFGAVFSKIDSEKPDLAILVDYPGFNLRLAKELKKRSIPVVYYISPQVWAWGADRIEIIKECVKKIVVFFEFEEELYRSHGIDAEFVGHPLVDTVKASMPKAEVIKKYGLSEGKRTIALLPGSRAMEVKKLLPTMLSAAALISKKVGDVQFVVAKFEGLPLRPYEDAVKKSGLDVKIADKDAYNILAASDFAIVTSGTATLETAIIGTPFVIVYKMNPLSYIITKLIAKIPYAGLPNIIAGKEIVPELLQWHASPENIARRSVEILASVNAKEAMKQALVRVRLSLGSPGASIRAAGAILPLL